MQWIVIKSIFGFLAMFLKLDSNEFKNGPYGLSNMPKKSISIKMAF